MSEKYTHIPVMYVDGDNYKARGDYVARGEITAEQKERLSASLGGHADGNSFIPAQVGHDHMGSNEWALRSDTDGPWHDMYLDEIEVNENPRGEGWAEDAGDIEDFVSKMEAAGKSGWDEVTYEPEYPGDEDDEYEDEDDDYSYGPAEVAPAPAAALASPTPSPAAPAGDQGRHPAGSRKGGQFTPKTTSESGVQLDAPAPAPVGADSDGDLDWNP